MWEDLYTTLYSFNRCRKFLLSSQETFFCKIWKMFECQFWANVMLRQFRIWASRDSPAQKSQDLRAVCSKNFSRATFFVFWVTWLEDSYLNNLRRKQIWRKSPVWTCGPLCYRGLIWHGVPRRTGGAPAHKWAMVSCWVKDAHAIS